MPRKATKTVPLWFYATPDQAAALDALCDETGASRAEQIRRAISHYLEWRKKAFAAPIQGDPRP